MKPTKIILFFVLSILVFSCRKDQPELSCDVTEPSSEQQEVSADFTMEEITGVLG